MQENGEIDFTVVSDNEDRIISGIQGCKGYGQYNGSCNGADHETAAQARSHGLSVGKYKAYLELSEYDSSVTADDCKNMTMRQIRDMIAEHTDENHSGNGSNHANGQQHGQHRKNHNE